MSSPGQPESAIERTAISNSNSISLDGLLAQVGEIAKRAEALKSATQIEWAQIEAARAALKAECESSALKRKRLDDDAEVSRRRLLDQTKAECAITMVNTSVAVSAERVALKRDIQAWENEKAQIARTFALDDEIVTINTGFASVSLPRTRLTEGEGAGTMFAAYLSGRHTVKRLGDGSVFVDSFPKAVPTLLAYLRDPSSLCDLPNNAHALRENVMEAGKFFVMPATFFAWLSSVTVGHEYELMSFLRGKPVSWAARLQKGDCVASPFKTPLVAVEDKEIAFKQCTAVISALSVKHAPKSQSETFCLPVTFVDSSKRSFVDKLRFSLVSGTVYGGVYDSVLVSPRTGVCKITFSGSGWAAAMQLRGSITINRDVLKLNGLKIE